MDRDQPSWQHEPLVDRPRQGRVYEAARRVRLGDCSPGGRMRFDACARYLQDIANDDSRDAGSPNPTAWVARRTVIRIDRFPEYLEMVSLATWCSGLGARWAERRYTIETAETVDPPGTVDVVGGTVEANTLWVHVDMATMRPVPVPADFAEHFAQAADGRQVTARLRLPSRPPATDVLVGTWPLRFSDFDVLGHVNNSLYWAMVEEHLSVRRDIRAPVTVTIEHHAGIDPGDTVTITSLSRPDGFDLWVTAGAGRLAAVVRAELGVR